MENHFVLTRAAAYRKNAVKDLVIENYEAPKKKSNPMKQTETVVNHTIRNRDLREKQEKEMKKARFEVIKFGMSGFEKSKAKEAKVALAISLGAKPPRNKRKNYKVLQEEKKREKEQTLKTEQFSSGLNKSLKKVKSWKHGKHKKESGILGVYGRVKKT